MLLCWPHVGEDGWMAGSGLAWPYHTQMWQETDLGELALRQMRLCVWVSQDRSEGDSLVVCVWVGEGRERERIHSTPARRHLPQTQQGLTKYWPNDKPMLA